MKVHVICRARRQQMIQPQDYDWPAVFQRLYQPRAVYGEVYAPSLSKANRAQLAAELQKFVQRAPFFIWP